MNKRKREREKEVRGVGCVFGSEGGIFQMRDERVREQTRVMVVGERERERKLFIHIGGDTENTLRWVVLFLCWMGFKHCGKIHNLIEWAQSEENEEEREKKEN